MILTQMNQCKFIFHSPHLLLTRNHLTVPSIIKAHFCWTWQCTTLNRGDEIASLLMCCLQPYQLFIPDYTTADGRRSGMGRSVFGVLSMYHETKVPKPGVREPSIRCIYRAC